MCFFVIFYFKNMISLKIEEYYKLKEERFIFEKKFMKKILIGLFSTIVVSVAAQRVCVTPQKMEEFYNANPTEKAKRQDLRNFLNTEHQFQAKKTVVTIPVVVHVLYSNTTMNISQAQIDSQLAVLNADFRKLNTDFSTAVPPYFQSFASDMELVFCLATVDPNGNPTAGVQRKSVAASFNFNNNYYTASGLTAWDPTRYLNIWVGNVTGGLLGWAYQPGAAGYPFDGLAIGYFCFGTTGTAQYPYNKGRTATHEIGHYFGLDHIWGDDGSTCGSPTNTDFCADTPTTFNPYYGAPTYPNNTYMCTPTAHGAMFMNYMDYVDDRAMAMFTNNQKTITRNALMGPRASLLNSNACTVLSVSDVEMMNTVIVFPNPTTQYISVAGQVKIDELHIFNSEGRLVKKSLRKDETTKIEVSELPAGVYYVRTYMKGEFIKSLKFIKK